jgi:outer membrane beta-barrel protein
MIRRANSWLLMMAVISLPLMLPGNALAQKGKGKKKPAAEPPPAAPAPAPAEPKADEPEIDMTKPDEAKPEEKPADTTGGEDMGKAADPELDMTQPEETPAEAKAAKDDKDLKLGETRGSWQDIVVVVRKPFLKMNRLELMPSVGITINDNMIQHYELNGQINYYLTDVLAVGVEGQYFVKNFLETYDLVARQDRRLPTINKYNYGAALNFHYVPIYAKFSILNKKIVHLETLFTAGVGITQSEVIPRDPALPAWTNSLITPNVGLTFRVFVADWVTLNLGFKDYIFIDKFEDVNRSEDQACAASVTCSQDHASGKLINHVMFSAGLSFWFPTSFRYTTFR